MSFFYASNIIEEDSPNNSRNNERKTCFSLKRIAYINNNCIYK